MEKSRACRRAKSLKKAAWHDLDDSILSTYVMFDDFYASCKEILCLRMSNVIAIPHISAYRVYSFVSNFLRRDEKRNFTL